MQDSKDVDRFRDIYFRNIQGIAFVARMDFMPLLMEGRVLEITGYEPEEFLSHKRPWNSLVHPEDRFGPEDASKLPIEPGFVLEHEYRIVRKDGELRWLHESISFICDDSGAPCMVHGTLLDVTRRKTLELGLKESEERYRTLFQHASEGILVADAETKEFLYANPRICAMLGYSREEMEQMSLFLLHPPELMSQMVDQFERQFRGEITLVRDTPCLRKDGAIIYVDISTAAAVIDGRACSVGFFQDATDRHAMRRDLDRRVEELVRLNSLSQAVAQALTSVEVMEAAVAEVLQVLGADMVAGYSVEGGVLDVLAVESHNLLQPLAGDVAKGIGECICNAAAKGGKPQFLLDVDDDTRCTRPQCSQAGIRSYAALPLMRNKVVIGVIGVGSVRTRQFQHHARFLESMAAIVSTGLAKVVYHERLERYSKDLEQEVARRAQELARSEERFRAIFEEAEEAIFIHDLDGRIADVNAHAVTLLGYGRAELKGMLVADLACLDDQPLVERQFQAAVAGRSVRLECRLQQKGGGQVHVEVQTKRIGDHVIGMARDETERKHLEQLKEDVERMMRHDLKGPLNAIINLPDIYFMEHEDIDPEVRRVFTTIRENGLRLHNLVDMSLKLYQMETGSYRCQAVDVNLAGILVRLAADLHPWAKDKELRLLSQGRPLAENGALLARGEELLCYSLFSNLLGNALEASDQGDVVTVDAECNEQCVVTVHNARPVPENIRNTFFDKYVTSGKSRGVGLGTYNAKLMAEIMGGGVRMETSRERGTTLTVILPKGG